MSETITMPIREYLELKSHIETAAKILKRFENSYPSKVDKSNKKQPLITDTEAREYLLRLYSKKTKR